MSRPKNLRDETEENKRKVRMVMLLSGLFFAMLGAVCVASPDAAAELLDMDKDTTRTLGFALIFVGLVESLVIPKILFRSIDRK